MKIYHKIHIDFMLASTASILQPMDQGVMSTFKSCYLRNTFLEATATKESDSSDGSGQSKLKTFWKGFTILDAIKNVGDSWKEIKISTRIGVWKKLIQTSWINFFQIPIHVDILTSFHESPTLLMASRIVNPFQKVFNLL